MRVEVVYCPAPQRADESTIELPEASTLLDALRASGVLQRHPAIDLDRDAVGVWGCLRPVQARLHEGDRVEVYRALTVDPKEARRRRAAKATCSPRR